MIPIVTQPDGMWEIEFLRTVKHDRFLYLKPSVRILHQERFDAAIAAQPGPAWLFARPSCYLAIYDRATLQTAISNAPTIFDKETSIRWESRLHDLLPYPTIWPQIADRRPKRIDTINGQPELIIGNSIIEKAKGTVRCRRCPHWPSPGICPHISRRVNAVPAQARRNRVEP